MTNSEQLEEIRKQIRATNKPLAVHEFLRSAIGDNGISANNLATRISEWAKAGYLIGNFRAGKSFKEWSIGPGPGGNPVAAKPRRRICKIVGMSNLDPMGRECMVTLRVSGTLEILGIAGRKSLEVML